MRFWRQRRHADENAALLILPDGGMRLFTESTPLEEIRRACSVEVGGLVDPGEQLVCRRLPSGSPSPSPAPSSHRSSRHRSPAPARPAVPRCATSPEVQWVATRAPHSGSFSVSEVSEEGSSSGQLELGCTYLLESPRDLTPHSYFAQRAGRSPSIPRSTTAPDLPWAAKVALAAHRAETAWPDYNKGAQELSPHGNPPGGGPAVYHGGRNHPSMPPFAMARSLTFAEHSRCTMGVLPATSSTASYEPEFLAPAVPVGSSAAAEGHWASPKGLPGPPPGPNTEEGFWQWHPRSSLDGHAASTPSGAPIHSPTHHVARDGHAASSRPTGAWPPSLVRSPADGHAASTPSAGTYPELVGHFRAPQLLQKTHSSVASFSGQHLSPFRSTNAPLKLQRPTGYSSHSVSPTSHSRQCLDLPSSLPHSFKQLRGKELGTAPSTGLSPKLAISLDLPPSPAPLMRSVSLLPVKELSSDASVAAAMGAHEGGQGGAREVRAETASGQLSRAEKRARDRAVQKALFQQELQGRGADKMSPVLPVRCKPTQGRNPRPPAALLWPLATPNATLCRDLDKALWSAPGKVLGAATAPQGQSPDDAKGVADRTLWTAPPVNLQPGQVGSYGTYHPAIDARDSEQIPVRAIIQSSPETLKRDTSKVGNFHAKAEGEEGLEGLIEALEGYAEGVPKGQKPMIGLNGGLQLQHCGDSGRRGRHLGRRASLPALRIDTGTEQGGKHREWNEALRSPGALPEHSLRWQGERGRAHLPALSPTAWQGSVRGKPIWDQGERNWADQGGGGVAKGMRRTSFSSMPSVSPRAGQGPVQDGSTSFNNQPAGSFSFLMALEDTFRRNPGGPGDPGRAGTLPSADRNKLQQLHSGFVENNNRAQEEEAAAAAAAAAAVRCNKVAGRQMPPSKEGAGERTPGSSLSVPVPLPKTLLAETDEECTLTPSSTLHCADSSAWTTTASSRSDIDWHPLRRSDKQETSSELVPPAPERSSTALRLDLTSPRALPHQPPGPSLSCGERGRRAETSEREPDIHYQAAASEREPGVRYQAETSEREPDVLHPAGHAGTAAAAEAQGNFLRGEASRGFNKPNSLLSSRAMLQSAGAFVTRRLFRSRSLDPELSTERKQLGRGGFEKQPAEPSACAATQRQSWVEHGSIPEERADVSGCRDGLESKEEVAAAAACYFDLTSAAIAQARSMAEEHGEGDTEPRHKKTVPKRPSTAAGREKGGKGSLKSGGTIQVLPLWPTACDAISSTPGLVQGAVPAQSRKPKYAQLTRRHSISVPSLAGALGPVQGEEGARKQPGLSVLSPSIKVQNRLTRRHSLEADPFLQSGESQWQPGQAAEAARDSGASAEGKASAERKASAEGKVPTVAAQSRTAHKDSARRARHRRQLSDSSTSFTAAAKSVAASHAEDASEGLLSLGAMIDQQRVQRNHSLALGGLVLSAAAAAAAAAGGGDSGRPSSGKKMQLRSSSPMPLQRASSLTQASKGLLLLGPKDFSSTASVLLPHHPADHPVLHVPNSQSPGPASESPSPGRLLRHRRSQSWQKLGGGGGGGSSDSTPSANPGVPAGAIGKGGRAGAGSGGGSSAGSSAAHSPMQNLILKAGSMGRQGTLPPLCKAAPREGKAHGHKRSGSFTFILIDHAGSELTQGLPNGVLEGHEHVMMAPPGSTTVPLARCSSLGPSFAMGAPGRSVVGAESQLVSGTSVETPAHQGVSFGVPEATQMDPLLSSDSVADKDVPCPVMRSPERKFWQSGALSGAADVLSVTLPLQRQNSATQRNSVLQAAAATGALVARPLYRQASLSAQPGPNTASKANASAIWYSQVWKKLDAPVALFLPQPTTPDCFGDPEPSTLSVHPSSAAPNTAGRAPAENAHRASSASLSARRFSFAEGRGSQRADQDGALAAAHNGGVREGDLSVVAIELPSGDRDWAHAPQSAPGGSRGSGLGTGASGASGGLRNSGGSGRSGGSGSLGPHSGGSEGGSGSIGGSWSGSRLPWLSSATRRSMELPSSRGSPDELAAAASGAASAAAASAALTEAKRLSHSQAHREASVSGQAAAQVKGGGLPRPKTLTRRQSFQSNHLSLVSQHSSSNGPSQTGAPAAAPLTRLSSVQSNRNSFLARLSLSGGGGGSNNGHTEQECLSGFSSGRKEATESGLGNEGRVWRKAKTSKPGGEGAAASGFKGAQGMPPVCLLGDRDCEGANAGEEILSVGGDAQLRRGERLPSQLGSTKSFNLKSWKVTLRGLMVKAQGQEAPSAAAAQHAEGPVGGLEAHHVGSQVNPVGGKTAGQRAGVGEENQNECEDSVGSSGRFSYRRRSATKSTKAQEHKEHQEHQGTKSTKAQEQEADDWGSYFKGSHKALQRQPSGVPRYSTDSGTGGSHAGGSGTQVTHDLGGQGFGGVGDEWGDYLVKTQAPLVRTDGAPRDSTERPGTGKRRSSSSRNRSGPRKSFTGGLGKLVPSFPLLSTSIAQ